MFSIYAQGNVGVHMGKTRPLTYTYDYPELQFVH